MKLYTEKEVRNAMIAGMHIGYSNQFNIDNINDDVDNAMKYRTSIELPSDEDIWEKILDSAYSLEYDTGFAQGAKWVINNIKQQDK